MKIALCQLNSIIGDIEGNMLRIINGYERGVKDGADLIICPELSLVGYPPQDLVEKHEFREKVEKAASYIASVTKEKGLIFGAITEQLDEVGTDIYNSALFCYNGKIQFIQNKTLLPNYDVFDEVRYFESAKQCNIHEFKGEKIGLSICEDIWNDADYWKKRRYPNDPVHRQIKQGASLLINISASPYAFGKREQRKEMLALISAKDKIPLAYVCCAGAQTDLIFDGGSMCFDAAGNLSLLGKTYGEDYFLFETTEKYKPIKTVEESYEKEATQALIFGIREYCSKTGFRKALVGLSGGIDSALVTYLAVEALGPENVHVVLMPSEYSSSGSIDDSLKLIENLGISSETLSIQPVFEKVKEVLAPVFGNLAEDVTEENIQPRIRALYLMSLSNKFRYLLLTTGNKSELGVGYATLYGDMCGALAVIADVYKTDVYKIANYINSVKEIIPRQIIEKPPSAELKPGQTDQDSLPPYELLDSILKMYLEENKELEEIVELTGSREIVKRILNLVDFNEFKRKQAAPALRISTKAFGYGRRFPIVQGWNRK